MNIRECASARAPRQHQQYQQLSTQYEMANFIWCIVHTSFLYEIYSLLLSRFVSLHLSLNKWMNEKSLENFTLSLAFHSVCFVFTQTNKHEVSSLNFILCSVCYGWHFYHLLFSCCCFYYNIVLRATLCQNTHRELIHLILSSKK